MPRRTWLEYYYMAGTYSGWISLEMHQCEHYMSKMWSQKVKQNHEKHKVNEFWWKRTDVGTKSKRKYFQNAKRGRFSMKKHQCECKKSESYKEMHKG